jgi:glycerophosphoryl diester phosphodiesterase
MKTKIFAHRGLSSKAPENTISAFKKAIDIEGIYGVEFDVQMTKDKKVVVIHDENIKRTTKKEKYIKDMNYKELNELDAGSWFSSEYKGEKIPLLSEVLEVLKNTNLFINIELKNSKIIYEGIEEEVLNIIKKLKIKNRIIISSFNYESLKIIRKLDGKIKIAVLSKEIPKNPIQYIKNVEGEALHIGISKIDKKIVQELKDNNIKVRCFTINTEGDFKKAIEYKIDGLFSDKSDYMVQLGGIKYE